MRRILVITSTSLVVILFLLGACGPSTPTTPTPGSSPTSAPEETSTTTTTAPRVTTPTPIPTPTPTPISTPAPSPPTTFREFADQKNGFFITYPATWTCTQLSEGVDIGCSKADVTVQVWEVAAGVTARQYLEMGQWMSIGVYYKGISTEEVVLAGQPAIKYMFLAQISGYPKTMLKMFIVIQIRERKAFQITCGVWIDNYEGDESMVNLNKVFDEYEGVFARILGSFRYLP